MMNWKLLTPLVLCVLIWACTRDDDPPPAPAPPATLVSFDESAVPYPTLSRYNFYRGEMHQLIPQSDVLPYELITPLFSDYASKKRFVWFPPGKGATYNNDHDLLDFDNGAVLIKNFYYDHMLPQNERRILETRLLYKINGDWHFAEYVWNDEQTEAYLNMDGSYRSISWLQDGVEKSTTYRIPSEGECLTCHKLGNKATPIGPRPQNLYKDYAYTTGVKNQLAKWAEVGYLRGTLPADVDHVVDWTDLLQPLELRMRAYLDINCASCHKEQSHCDYRPMRFAWSETADRENQGVCVEPHEMLQPSLLHIISPGNINRSMLHHRMASNDENVRMPLLGRSMVHTEAVQLVVAYINSLTEPCQ